MTDRRLDSWKEIARYLGRDVSTAIRWERERGLPVHRVPGGKRGGVYALTGEIDGWLRGVAADDGPVENVPATGAQGSSGTVESPGPAAAARRPRQVAPALVAAVALAATAAGWLLLRRAPSVAPEPVASVAFAGTRIQALGADGRVLWSHDFGRSLTTRRDPVPYCAPQTFDRADLDGDKRPDLVVSVRFAAAAQAPAHDELFAFSSAGRPLWSHRLDDELTFGAGRYAGPWIDPDLGADRGRTVVAFDVDGAKRIAWAEMHHVWWPSILTLLDAHGRVLSKWVHGGVIYALLPAEDPLKPRLLVGGISNARESAFVAVLDARHAVGSGPEEPGSPYDCLSCAPGRPLRYLSLAPSELMQAVAPYNHVFDLRPDSGGFEVHTTEAPGVPPTPYAVQGITTFSSAFELLHASWSSGWDARHRELEQQGRLQHAAAQCPNRDGRPRVREWTPDRGWRELTPADAGSSVAAR